MKVCVAKFAFIKGTPRQGAVGVEAIWGPRLTVGHSNPFVLWSSVWFFLYLKKIIDPQTYIKFNHQTFLNTNWNLSISVRVTILQIFKSQDPYITSHKGSGSQKLQKMFFQKKLFREEIPFPWKRELGNNLQKYLFKLIWDLDLLKNIKMCQQVADARARITQKPQNCCHFGCLKTKHLLFQSSNLALCDSLTLNF